MTVVSRSGINPVALETTLLLHGIPSESAMALSQELSSIIREQGATPALIGVLDGRPVIGLSDAELQYMLDQDNVPKVNSANLGVAIHLRQCGATTVGSTMELAAQARLKVFATGGIGGVHHGYGSSLDISSDLAAFTRFSVAVVTSGVKSILDVNSTREALETLGVCVVGYRCSSFPAFYLRESDVGVDVRFDELGEMAAFLDAEMKRTKRGIVVANPIPEKDAISVKDWNKWLDGARELVEKNNARGRDLTPAILAALHEVSGGKTLEANLALVKSNVRLAAQLAVAISTF